MVTLRIWQPSHKQPGSRGYCSLTLDAACGVAYVSVRPAPTDAPGERGGGRSFATLADDIAAEGGDTPHQWRFRNLDEARMLRVWDQFKGLAAAHSTSGHRDNCFHFCDMLLAAGQGVDVEAFSGAALRNRAQGALHLATLAVTHATLAAHAEDYLKVRHF